MQKLNFPLINKRNADKIDTRNKKKVPRDI